MRGETPWVILLVSYVILAKEQEKISLKKSNWNQNSHLYRFVDDNTTLHMPYSE